MKKKKSETIQDVIAEAYGYMCEELNSPRWEIADRLIEASKKGRTKSHKLAKVIAERLTADDRMSLLIDLELLDAAKDVSNDLSTNEWRILNGQVAFY